MTSLRSAQKLWLQASRHRTIKMRFLLLFLGVLLVGCTTTDQSKVAQAVTAPLGDLNLVDAPIPESLAHAQKGPYAVPDGPGCSALMSEVRVLDADLGPDLDTPASESNPSLIERGSYRAMGAVRKTAEGVVPYRRWVRKLSGAENHDKFVQSAIIAGNVRRAYLKGLGEARGCPAPATPSTERRLAAQAAPAPPAAKAGPTPKFPVRTEPAAPRTTGGTPQTAPRR